ncbi:phosphatase [Piscirickettsia salmonis]|nr:phosphatase [Piscirickettsia salmonis LF-89 = ATCC VR-1361]ALY04204.1 phosphatase [Piscirickettsia salmonis]AMA43761.1 phosphatase [Piscirickettsia salmonis]AOS36686.1 phosphatase [Piscirickettsia salmonis]APS62034.1 phosphatase [Piscirickettsia salmonis]
MLLSNENILSQQIKQYQSFKHIIRKRRYLGRYFAHPMMQNRRAKRDDYKPSAVRVTQRYVP